MAAPSGASPPPPFVLNDLGHVEEKQPIWLDRFFFPWCGDTHAENTELLGFDQKKGGDVAALLAVLTFVVEKTRDERKEELARVGIADSQLLALDKAIQIFKGGVALGKGLTQINTPDQFASFLFQFKSAVRNMAPTEKLLLPGGFRSMEGGHAIMHFLERTESAYSLTVHNTGKGIAYHPSTVTAHPKTKYRTTLKFTNISAEKILDDAFWYMFWKQMVSTSDDHRCEVLYEVLLPHLLDACVGVAIARQDAADPKAAQLCEYRTAQRAEVNYLKSMTEALRYLLREEGWTAAQTKHFSFLMRRQVIDFTAQDLNEVQTITEADAKLLRVAAQKLARKATKESETNPLRLDAEGLEEVYAQVQWIESQINEKLSAQAPVPLLQMTMKGTFEPYPNFQLFRRLAPVEQFAGWKKDRPGNDLIDFLALPARGEEIRHFGDLLQSLVQCHSLCERLSTKSSSAAYYHRIALIQDYFTNILPRPLPPYRNRKATLDGDGKEVAPKECLYATAIIDRATQLQVLNLLLELARHYLASCKSVSSNRAFESAHAIVMATIVAVADAVMRIPACDETSVVTMVLNGTESRHKGKGKSFASPYENMNRGRFGMQSQIAGLQSTLGQFGLPQHQPAAAPRPAATTTTTTTAPSRSNLPTIEVVVPSHAPATGSATATTAAASTAGGAAPMVVDAGAGAAPAAAPAAAPLDADTQAKLLEAQRLLSEALASFAKQKAAEKEAMAAAAERTVTPLFYTSLQNGRGVEFIELSEKLLLTQPSLAVARGEVLEYFTSQSEVASKAIFNFPTRMNCSTYFGKDGAMLELVKVLCNILGYDLNPDAEKDKDGKDGAMDDQISFIEAATWYLTHPKSPFAEHQPELFVYRDLVAMYHIIVAQTDHRRSIKVHRWNVADTQIKYRVKEVNRVKTMIDINFELMGEEAVCLDSLPMYSAADASSYVTDVAMPTEDDVLHAQNLPSFGDILSEEDSEMLISYLTAPYIRIPLVIAFFSTKDRVAVLKSRDIQSMVQSVLFEPRQWVTEYETPPITQIPAASRAQIGASRGMLLNEIIHNPQVLLKSLLTMGELVMQLNTGDYTSSSREIILFVIRMMARVEAHLVHVLENTADVFRHHRAPSADYIRSLEDGRAELRTFLLDTVRPALLEWEEAASADNDLISCCVFHAHLALLYRGVRGHEWTAESVASVLQHSAFLRTWYSAGLTAEQSDEQSQVGDNFYASNAHGMATRFGMSHTGRGGGMIGGMMGGRGGGILGGMMGRRFGQGAGRGLGDDADEADGSEESSMRGRRGGRRGGRRSLKAGGSGKESDEKEEKKSKSESDDEAEDDLNLPGLGEEAAVEKLKEKNPGEGKAPDAEVLEMPDQEVFECMQYLRRGYVGWLAKAAADQVDDVLQGTLGASTRTRQVVSRGWTLISSTPGLWRSRNEDLEINCQTSELFFKHSTIEPVPNTLAQQKDFGLLFGVKPLHCALVAMHDHRYWVRMVGSAFSLKRWDRVEPELVVVNQPVPIPTPTSGTLQWICFNDGQANPIEAPTCSKCSKREKPKFPFGFRFEDEQYGRMFVPVPTQMQAHEKWIYDAIEPVLGALFGGRGKMAWELFLPTAITEPNAQMVHLIGRDETRTFREVIVHRQRSVAQIYSILEHGRRVFRSLEYTSDTRFTHRYVDPDVRDRAQEWAPQVRHAAGKLVPAFWDASLVITRDRTDAFGKVTEETFIPSRFLYGLLPSALLDNFFFWQRAEDDGFVGFPRDRTQPNWFYQIHVRLVQLPDGNTGKVQYSAVVTRHKLDPDTIDREDPRASDTDGASSFEMKKQLASDDPLLVAINQSKVATLKEMGYSESVASGVLKRFDYDLAIAQSWLADPTNAAEIEALKSADPATAAAINEASASSSFNIADGAGSKHQLLLLNLLHAAPGSMLYRLATVLTRIEDLSNILCWSASSVSAVGDEVSISLIECPRLKLRLQPRVYLDSVGVESIRLYSLDHSNMYVSDTRSDLLNKLLDGLTGTILFENNEHELFVLSPNCIVHRPIITSSPFSAELVFERGAGSWMAAQESRCFWYPVHGSHTFMFTPTQASAVYLILLRLLGRQYTEAYSVVQSCEADRKLSESEDWVLQQLANAATDFHPNAAAIRLKLSLVILHSQAPWPWRVQDEYRLYLEKLNNVSAICRLSIDEEIYLLKHLRSGAEMEDLEAAAGGDDNELDEAPRHLDVALANRLNFLTAMIAEEEEYEHESAGLRFDAKHESVPLLTRTRSGRKQAYLEKPVQRGCKNLWSEVESAVDRYYSDFSFNSRTWDAQIEYARPDQQATMLGPAIKTLNGVWKDTITGLGRKLGFFFLTDLLTRQVDICLTDPGNSSSASLGKLLGRLLLLKSTAWGIRWDLNCHRSYRERSFVPFVLLALLEHLPVSVAKAAPKLPFMQNRAELINGCSISNKPQDGPEMSSAAKYLEALAVFCQQFKSMPNRANDPAMKVQVIESTESIIVPPIQTILTAPQPTDFACNQRTLRPFTHEEVVLTEVDAQCFSDQLLSCIDLDKYVSMCPSDERVADEVPFDVSRHVDAQTHVAKQLLARTAADVKVYAKMVNEGTIPKIACLLDDTLVRFTQLDKTPEQGYSHDDATLTTAIHDAIGSLNALIVDLDAIAAQDAAQIPISVTTVLDLANQVEEADESVPAAGGSDADVPMAADGAVDTPLHRNQFILRRYSELKPALTLDYLSGCLLSTHVLDDIHAVNPFVPKRSEPLIMDIVQSFLLRVNRLGHIHRCASMVVELIGLLRGIAHMRKTGAEGQDERQVYHKALTFKSSALASALVTRRFCFGPEAFVPQVGSPRAMSPAVAQSSPTRMDFEPRYLLFEYLFNILLRNQQVKLLHTFLTSSSSVQQMIMGMGKTTVVGPLLGLILADGSRLVTQVVPSALLEFSRSVMRGRFTRIITKRVQTFDFDRSVKKIRHVTRLFDKLNAARKTRGIVMTSPESIKALMLKHAELMSILEEAPANLTPPAQLRLKIRSEMADQLSKILHMWRRGSLILDEVDLLLHPLKSELNFPIGPKEPLDLSPDRWELPIHLIDSVFYSMYSTMSVPFGQSASAFAILDQIKSIIDRGVSQHAIQTSPHLVLLDLDFYHAEMKTPLAHWLLCWLKSKQHLSVRLTDEDAVAYLAEGPLGAPKEVVAQVTTLHNVTQRKVLNLSHDWLSSFLPHCLSKINRVSMGLLTPEDMSLVDQNMPTSRKLCAVPFVGKDVPSHASEFAMPEIVIGLTILAYRYEGMRRSDVRRVVASLQRKMRNEIGPFSQRPSSILFDAWCTKGKVFAQLLHDRQVEDEMAEARVQAKQQQANATTDESKMDESSSSASSAPLVAPPKRKLKLLPIVPLAIFQLSDKLQFKSLFQRVRQTPDLIHFYLERLVFPAVLNSAVQKLSASGQELGGSLLFDRRYGFSGTPSDLLPLELGSCGYELGSEGNITTTLTDPSIVHAVCKSEWSVRKLLTDVANSGAHALIDTGALITGFTNLEVARYLLENGLPGIEGVIFLDRLDRQMILLRASFTVIPLAQCGLDRSLCFTWYDQIHTTGIDVKQALNAMAIVTLGKDMTFRDYAQGAFRMRGIGKGQTISLYIIPEVLKLIEAEAKSTAKPGQTLITSVAAWLTVNSMRSERLQFMALCGQSMKNVWRKRAFEAMLRDTTPNEDLVDERRYWRFSEVFTPELIHVRRCINTFREPIDFEIQGDVTEAKTFSKMLAEELGRNRDLIAHDPTALADIQHIETLASGTVGASTELQTRSLNSEMVSEQQQEQEKRKQVENEEQSQVRFSREDEHQRSWKIFELARSPAAQPGATPLARAGSTTGVHRTGASGSVASSSSIVAASGTVHDAHPFYPFNQFSVRGIHERDIDLPGHLMLSSNWYRAEWAAMGQRRLKNITIVLEQVAKSKVSAKGACTTAGCSTGSASATAMEDVASASGVSFAFSSSSILSPAQELSLKTSFRMFADDATQTISVAQLRVMMREVGEDMSPQDVRSLNGQATDQLLDYATFRQFMINRSANRTDLHGRRNFVAVSLKEAESLRRLIHTYHPLFAVQSDPSQQVSIGLRLLNGALLDASPAFQPVDEGQQALALQSLRFIDCQMFYNDLQLSLLLKSLQHNKPIRRQAFFENLLRCRRRDRRIFTDTPLNSLFLLSDEFSLLSYRAKVARVRFCLHGLNLSLQDAFVKFDALGDTSLNTTELAFALREYLKLPLSMEDVAQLMTFANKKGDGLLDYEEFAQLLRQPEVVSQTQNHNEGMNDLKLIKSYSQSTAARMEIDEEEGASSDAMPSAVPVPIIQRQVSTTRLTLTPEYERLYAEEESLRVRKASETESEAEMARLDKLAREIEKKELEEAQARDWKEVQEMRQLAALEERWTCGACTFKNEPTALFCVVCESKRPEQQQSERKQDIQDIEDNGDGHDGPTWWSCASCSYNNDQANAACEVCNATKPKVQRAQKKLVSLWSCPICTRLVTSDKQQCDVCTSDKEAIRTVSAVPEPQVGKGFAALFGDSLIGRDGVPMHASELTGKTVGVYFSGSWCGPCRAFTPQLASIYAGARAANLPFEILFVSADNSIEEFAEYFREMPWKAVKYSDVDLRKRLNAAFDVSGIPTLVVLDQNGNVLTATGREDIGTVGDAAVPAWCARGSSAPSGGSDSAVNPQ